MIFTCGWSQRASRNPLHPVLHRPVLVYLLLLNFLIRCVFLRLSAACSKQSLLVPDWREQETLRCFSCRRGVCEPVPRGSVVEDNSPVMFYVKYQLVIGC